MQKLFGEDVLYRNGSKYPNLAEPNRFLSHGYSVDFYFPPCKRSRVGTPFIFHEKKFKKQQTTIDVLPDECLFEILRRVSGPNEKSACAFVSKRWLNLLSTICKDEIFFQESDSKNETEDLEKSNACLTRCLKGKKATDTRLAAMAVGTSSCGGLSELSILGDDESHVTDFGLKAVARGCSLIKNLTLWNLTSITDIGLIEIAEECRYLEKLELSQCNAVSDRSLLAIAKNCSKLTSLTLESCANIGNEGLRAIGQNCHNLKCVSIKKCVQIGDQGVVGLFSSSDGCNLTKVKLQLLCIGDVSLAVIGHYGIEVTNLVFGGLRNVTEKGFWVMGNSRGLQKMCSLEINTCSGVTDLGLESIAKGCPNLKEFCLRKPLFLSDSGLVSFAKNAQSLENLWVDACPKISQLGLFGLITNGPNLKTLRLSNCLGINDLPIKPVSALSPHNSLRSLSIYNCPGFGNISLSLLGFLCWNLQIIMFTGLHGITDSGFAPLVGNSKVGLTQVKLTNCPNVTSKFVSEIANLHGRTLQVLKLDGCKSVNDASLVAIANNCINLVELDVSKTGITDVGIVALACSVYLNIKILSVSGCSLVSDKSVPYLVKLGETLFGLNILNCPGISERAVSFIVGQMWSCDILC